MNYDVVIVGSGPGGLSAALALGRARKRVLLCDSGPRRNARAQRIHNFVTQDGTPPELFRAVGREQLTGYPNVQVVESHVESISGGKGAFEVALATGVVQARRVLLCTGMVDEILPIKGFRELWGRSIFQCPYCHGWEVQDRVWGYLARSVDAHMLLHFALQARAWTRDLVVFTNGVIDLPLDTRAALGTACIRIETEPVADLLAREDRLEAIVLANGTVVPCDVLFAHPPQRQVDLVCGLGLALDEYGYVQVDPMKRETSIPGIYAAGDLATRMQSAIFAAAAGTQAAVMINVDLTAELVLSGGL